MNQKPQYKSVENDEQELFEREFQDELEGLNEE